MTERHYPGTVLTKQDFPAGRGKRLTIATVQTSPPRKKKSKYSKDDYVNAIALGRNPLQSYTYNLATDKASLDYYNKGMKLKNYEVLGRHDEEELLAFLLVTRSRQRQKKKEKRLESRDSRERERESNRRPDICHAGLSSRLLTIPSHLRLSADLRERMERISKKFEAAERKRAARHHKLVNYKNGRSNFVSRTE